MRLVVDKSPASSQVALDQIVVNDLAALHFFRPALFDSILVAGSELTLDLAAQLAQLLKPDALLTLQNAQVDSQLLQLVGLFEKDPTTFQKRTLQQRALAPAPSASHPRNAYGKYDYIVQTFVNENPFEDFAKTQGREQIDEEALLQDDVEVKQVESCASKPRACANCTCGRKELEDQQDKEQLLKDLAEGKVNSSCGSCYLGDAFRCANCPYRGLPAFKQGENIKIKQLDENQVTEERPAVKEEGGVVKLKI